jgi:hypothetical protein
MDMWQAPTASAFDAVTSLLTAALYLAVALGTLAFAPRDLRARLFAVVALTSVAPYAVSARIWQHGSGAFAKPFVVLLALSLGGGSLALFHFFQVFPWRRPWIRAHARWLYAGYLVVPFATLLAAWVAPERAEDVSVEFGIAMLVVGLPSVALIFIVLPFGGLLSLYKSWLAARASAIRSARVATFWMLISQVAGGVLAILIVPALHVIAPVGPLVTTASALVVGFGLLMPLAFAASAWRLHVLDLPIDAPPEN